ncbi:MAG: carbamoyl-phosphate synthase large subunit, partial [Lentisphaerae bacterium]
QKVIEESGSTLLPDELKKVAFESAGKLADAVDYTGAGTVEFIFSLKDQAVYFMEMNTRLQIEHPVTEKVTGVDIVRAQFDIAAGKSIRDLKWQEKGYAMELRINAEKPEIQPDGSLAFIPAPGKVKEYVFPERDYIDILSAIDAGVEIPPYYDSMVMQLICTGEDRNDCIEKLSAYLDEVKITGVYTNLRFLKAILDDEVFRSGEYDTGYLPEFFKRKDMEKLIREIEESSDAQPQNIDSSVIRIADSDELKVLAQSTAVFYRTPAPSEPEFVKVGDVVTVDDTLCLLEAMKLFRPLSLAMYNSGPAPLYPPDQKYEIVRINPANGQAINPGDILFIIKPVS